MLNRFPEARPRIDLSKINMSQNLNSARESAVAWWNSLSPKAKATFGIVATAALALFEIHRGEENGNNGAQQLKNDATGLLGRGREALTSLEQRFHNAVDRVHEFSQDPTGSRNRDASQPEEMPQSSTPSYVPGDMQEASSSMDAPLN